MSVSLTQAQAELLAFIQRYTDENDGVAPSFEEMKQELGLASKSGVHRLVSALQERGRLSRLRHRARAMVVLPENPVADLSTETLIAALVARGDAVRIGNAAIVRRGIATEPAHLPA